MQTLKLTLAAFLIVAVAVMAHAGVMSDVQPVGPGGTPSTTSEGPVAPPAAAPVPEPATLAFVGLGSLGVMAMRRRQRKA